MKRSFSLLLAAVALAVTTAVHAADRGRGRPYDGLAVAETGPAFSPLPAASPDHPLTYAVYDGGYIEAGDPVAGENPPTPGAVAQAFRTALADKGYRAAEAGQTPAIDLVIHWGVLRISTFRRRGVDVDPNFFARLSLITSPRLAQEMRSELRAHLSGAPLLSLHRPEWRDALQLCQDARYFFIVSAYDHAALLRGEIAPVWRVRLSTADNADRMSDVVPALAALSPEYFGQSLPSLTYIRVPRYSAPESQEPEPFPAAVPLSGGANEKILEQIVAQEHDYFSGEKLPPWNGDAWTLDADQKAAETAELPSSLKSEIAKYQAQKRELQDALAQRISAAGPGADQARVIDAFNSENARKISALNRRSQSIRAELARFSAKNPTTRNDRTVDALIKEFAQDSGLVSLPPAENR